MPGRKLGYEGTFLFYYIEIDIQVYTESVLLIEQKDMKCDTILPDFNLSSTATFKLFL